MVDPTSEIPTEDTGPVSLEQSQKIITNVDDYIRKVISDFEYEDSEKKHRAFVPRFLRYNRYRRFAAIQSYEDRRYYVCFAFDPKLLYTVIVDKSIDFTDDVAQLQLAINQFMAKKNRGIRGFIIDKNALALSFLIFINIETDPANYRNLIRRQILYMIRKYSKFSFERSIRVPSAIKQSSSKTEEGESIFDTIRAEYDDKIDKHTVVVSQNSAKSNCRYLLKFECYKDNCCRITFQSDTIYTKEDENIKNYVAEVNSKLKFDKKFKNKTKHEDFTEFKDKRKIPEFSIVKASNQNMIISCKYEFKMSTRFEFEYAKTKFKETLDSFFIGLDYLQRLGLDFAIIEFELNQDEDLVMRAESSNTREYAVWFNSKAEFAKEKECISKLHDLSQVFSLDSVEFKPATYEVIYKFPCYKSEEIFTNQYDKVHEILTIMQGRNIKVKNFLQKLRFFDCSAYYVYDEPLQNVLEYTSTNPHKEIKSYLKELLKEEPGFSELDMLPSKVMNVDEKWGLPIKKRKVPASFSRKLHNFKSLNHRYKVPILGIAKQAEEYYVITQKLKSNLKKKVRESNYSRETIKKWCREITKLLNTMVKRNVFIEELHLSQVKIDDDLSAMVDLCSVSDKYPYWKAPEEIKGVLGHKRINYRLGNILYCLVEKTEQLFEPEEEEDFLHSLVYDYFRPIISNENEFNNSEIHYVIQSLWLSKPFRRSSFASILEKIPDS